MFLLCSGFTALVSLGQNVILASVPSGIIAEINSDTAFARTMPSAAGFSLTVRTFAAMGLLLSGMMVGASVGLLKRRTWARVTFMCLMCLLVLGAAYSAVGLVIQGGSMPSFKAPRAPALGPLTRLFQQGAATSRDDMIAFDLGLIALCMWILVKLRSPRVRAEFSPRGRAA